MTETVHLIQGAVFTDKRGSLSYINDFDFDNIRRMYVIEPSSIDKVRAWQGHKTEWKYFYVTKGSFTIGIVHVKDWTNPSRTSVPKLYHLNANEPKVLVVPGGYANGIKSNELGSKLTVFSSSTVEDSKHDEFRFDSKYWAFD